MDEGAVSRDPPISVIRRQLDYWPRAGLLDGSSSLQEGHMGGPSSLDELSG